jgi:hypothetical protein
MNALNTITNYNLWRVINEYMPGIAFLERSIMNETSIKFAIETNYLEALKVYYKYNIQSCWWLR